MENPEWERELNETMVRLDYFLEEMQEEWLNEIQPKEYSQVGLTESLEDEGESRGVGTSHEG